jgi:hypothetical protein
MNLPLTAASATVSETLYESSNEHNRVTHSAVLRIAMIGQSTGSNSKYLRRDLNAIHRSLKGRNIWYLTPLSGLYESWPR